MAWLCHRDQVRWSGLVAPVLWTVVVLSLSSGSWSAAHTGALLLPLLQAGLPWATPEQLEALHWILRKTAHVVEYGILAILWRHTLTRRGDSPWWRVALALTVLTAVVDEFMQAGTGLRGGSLLDVLLDTAAAAAALALLGIGLARTADHVTATLLWLAAAGGSLLLILTWAADAPLGWLLWSVPTAWLLLLFWYRGRRAA